MALDKKSKWKMTIWYSLIYTIVITLITMFFQYLPWAMELEYRLFDQMQSKLTVDHIEDKRYEKLKPILDQMTFIQLDTSCFNLETDRVIQDKLVLLLSQLRKENKQVNSLFLDYHIDKTLPESNALQDEILKWKDKVVLPFLLTNVGDTLRQKQRTLAIGKTENRTNVLPSAQYGYTNPLEDVYTLSNRFYSFQNRNDSTLFSVPSILWAMKKKKSLDKKNIPEGVYSLDFMLRNKDENGKIRAKIPYKAKDIINGTLPQETIRELMHEKTIFVGIFDKYYTKYDLPIDVFTTPVDKQMTGTLLLANAFINLEKGMVQTRAKWWWIVLLNFGLALLYVTWKVWSLGKDWNFVLVFICNMLVAFLVFPWFARLLFQYYNVFVPIGVSIFFFQYHFKFIQLSINKFSKKEKNE